MMILLIIILSFMNLLLWSDILYRRFFKRFYDILLSVFAIIVLLIPFLIVSFFVILSLGSPVFFKTMRVTKNQKAFKLLKFRSMRNSFDEDGIPLPDSERITRVGAFIRKTSLDELPSLFNIIKGDMSLVGPRPLPLNYLPWFTDEERKRFRVRAGLTGLAQINGRGELEWEKKFAYDCHYVESFSFWGDIFIIYKTVISVLKRKDIGERGIEAPPDFHCYRSKLTEKQLSDMEKAGTLPKRYEEWKDEKNADA